MAESDELPELKLAVAPKRKEKKAKKVEKKSREKHKAKFKSSKKKVHSIPKTAKKTKTEKKAYSRKIKAPLITPKTERAIAMDFASQVHRKFDSIIKATVMFGSQAKHKIHASSDIDIIIIIDDAAINWDLELIAWYREELAKLISASQYSRELHVNTIKLTTWWNDLMHGDPVILNILRYGEALIDIGGFYNPLKVLLMQGKIHSTPEAVHAALQRAPMHLARSKLSEMAAVEGIYWAMVDSAQAALITLGKLPPSPEHITEMLKTLFVDNNMLKMEYVKWYRDVFQLHKGIAHGQIRDIKGLELDDWQERAESFVLKMTEIIDQLIEARLKEEN